MISVGIDVSKGKSTVCILKPYGEIVSKPFNITHTQKDLSELSSMLFRLNDEVKIVMEATGIYHLPVLTYLQEKGFFVSVINPYLMKSYRNESLRKAKTDKIDSRIIANYGIDHWFKMKEFQTSGEIYEELKLLGQQYRHYMKLHLLSLAELTHLLDLTMPGIKNLLASWNETNRKDKRSDFVERFWHYDVITSMSEQEFTEEYILWAKEKKYVPSQEKAKVIYTLAQESIPTLPSETSSIKMLSLAQESIPTLPSETSSFKMLVTEAVRVLKEVDATLGLILSRMQEIAKTLPEYSVVREMGGVGNTLAPKLIAEIGDVRRFRNGKALVAFAGIDPPPYESGQFVGCNRKISKRGSASLRKVGYETMRSLKMHSRPEDPVYRYVVKKESEGKSKKSAKIAGLNKFLRIYYARVTELYKNI
ncbi:IS110 family transposase [Dorea longicatena]|uniref:IS110 family transposase n=6 Tax=Bacteria TaxID=2 RepID=A0A3E5G7R2_9FIRM|nr:IS110 family transposase [Dorea longicatena]RGO30381.1 IS110 family transposase [Dorea longicatena]